MSKTFRCARRLLGLAAALMSLCLPACGAPAAPDAKAPALADFELTETYFRGRAVVFYGDSITFGAGVDTAAGEKRYCDRMAEALDFDPFNLAVSGTALAMPRPDKGLISGCSIIAQNAALNAQAHFAVIAYGTNDFYPVSVPLGGRGDDPASAGEVESFYGAIRFAVKTLRAHNPGIRVLFLTPLARTVPSTPINMNTDTLPAFGEAIEALAAELDYRAVDIYGLFGRENFGAGGRYTADGLHPNAAGHARMADYLLGLDG